ncbi:MAG: hypothetical protein PHS49_02710 [Candidatus Gracilibacteria bacterium]|nr:hypothetical protein [Candidatus Gracilibacteria bacterium]
MKKILFYLSISIIFIYGIYIRYYELGTGSFWIDEGYSSIISFFSNINNFNPYLPTGKYDFSQYLFTFFQTLSFKLFGISDYSARLTSFILSILNMIVYLIFSIELLKNKKNNLIGIIFLFFIYVFSTWQIIWAREARFYELLSFIYFINIYFIWKYANTNKIFYFLLYLVFTLSGIIFHPFCFGLIVIGIIIILYKIFIEKNRAKIGYFTGIVVILIIYYLIDLGFNYISIGNIYTGESVPSINSIGKYNYLMFFNFYLKSLYSQLGIILISFILGIIYFTYRKKHLNLIIFGGVFLINILLIPYGYMAHSRYMYHIYSIITLIGGYNIILLYNYLSEELNIDYRKIITSLFIIVTIFGIYKTYNITILAQRYYYIDYTSPKPNFKMAYKYLDENFIDYKIISGFPQLCYWYNINNIERCSYAININLLGENDLNDILNKNQKENYTNISYINNINDIENLRLYFFVIDDLTLKNAINKDLIQQIKTKCTMIYKDIGNYETSNFIGIWKCAYN